MAADSSAFTLVQYESVLGELDRNRLDGRGDSAISAVSLTSYRATGQTFLWLG